MLRYLSLFSGIGAPEKALKNLGIPYELVGFSEIDKFAIKSYCAIHNVSEELNLGDITKINLDNLPKDIDLITHGSPCQSFSIAGKQAGGDEGSGTRSSLMWNTVEIVEKVKPKYVLWENVKNVLSKKHKPNFDKYLDRMKNLGYKNYYKILNAKNYGVPQNRERIFVISIRNDIEKDFKFPEPFDKGLRLKDILEKNVDERFYVSKEKCEKLIKELKPNTSKDFLLGGEQKHQAVKYDGISTTLTSSIGTGGGYIPMINTTPVSSSDTKIKIVGNTNPSKKGMNGNVYDESGLSPTLTCNKCDAPKICTHSTNDENIEEKIQPVITPDRLNKRQNGRRFKENGEPMFTLTAQDRHGVLEEKIIDKNTNSKIENDLHFVGGIGDEDIVRDNKKYSKNYPQGNRVYSEEGIACSQTANGGGIGGPTGLYLTSSAKRLGGIFDSEKSRHQAGSVWDKDYLSPTLDTMQGGYRQPCVMVKVANKQGYDIATVGDTINLDRPTSTTRRGRVEHEVAQTLDTGCNQTTLIKENDNEKIIYRIRRLTPLECFRLMGFDDIDCIKAEKECSKSQLYKQAGNSIVVNVLELIFKNLF